MSRIGRLPITVPTGVTVTVEGSSVSAKGTKGAQSVVLPEGISVVLENDQLQVSAKDPVMQSALWGLSRALLANLVTGVSEGFEKKLEIQGVGYRAQMQGKLLNLSMGFSHPVKFSVPDDVTVTAVEGILTISGSDRQRVGQIAAEIRSIKPVEPYKGKGIRYVGEHVRRKVGKRVAASSS